MRKYLITILFTALILLPGARAELRLPEIFADHAILQRSSQTPVWGRAEPGKTITVSLGEATGRATADASGKWMVWLDLDRIAAGPHQLIVSGDGEFQAEDVLVGEVWLASEQSNMEWILRDTLGAEAEIAACADSHLRHFRSAPRISPQPISAVPGA